MAYNGPVYNRQVEDVSPQLIAQGGQALGAGIGQGLSSLASGIADGMELKAKASEENDFLTSQWNVMARAAGLPEDEAEKFYSSSLGGKRGMLTSLATLMDREAKSAAEAENNRRFELNYGLDVARTQNAAAMQQAQVENMAADNARQQQRMEYELAPVQEQPFAQPIEGSGYQAVGTTSDRGTKIFNMVPLPQARPQPGYVQDPMTGLGFFQNAEGTPVNPDYLMTPDGPLPSGGMGPPESTLFDGLTPPAVPVSGAQQASRVPVRSAAPGNGALPQLPAPPGRVAVRPLNQKAAASAPRVVFFPDPSDETGQRKVPMTWDAKSNTWIPAPVQQTAAPAASADPVQSGLDSYFQKLGIK